MPSTYYTLMSQCKTSLNAVSGIPQIRIRKKPRIFKVDALPICLVCPGKGGERVANQAFKKSVVWEYPVTVLIVQSGNWVEETNTDAYLQLREDVRNALFTLGAVAQAFDFKVDPAEASDLQAELGSQFDVDGFQAWYRTNETRPN